MEQIMPSVELTLPWPPSVNARWRSGRGNVYLSKAAREYQDWAGIHAQQCLPSCCPFKVPVAVVILALYPNDLRRDLDNILKVVLDTLDGMGLYEDDSLVHELTAKRLGVDPNGAGHVAILVEPVKIGAGGF